MSAVCRCTAGPGGPTSDGAARAAAGGVADAASDGAVHAAPGGTVVADTGVVGTGVVGTRVVGGGVVGGGVVGSGVVGGGVVGSGAATGTSVPTRTCDHGTKGPRNGGASSGGRGAVYGSGLHVDRTSSGRFGT